MKVLYHCPCGDPKCNGTVDLSVIYDQDEWMMGRVEPLGKTIMGLHKTEWPHEFYVDAVSRGKCECGKRIPKSFQVAYKLLRMGE